MTPATFAPAVCCVNILKLLMNPLQQSNTSNIHRLHKMYPTRLNTIIQLVTLALLQTELEMWANAKRDGCPAEYRWRPLFNAEAWLTPTTKSAVQ